MQTLSTALIWVSIAMAVGLIVQILRVLPRESRMGRTPKMTLELSIAAALAYIVTRGIDFAGTLEHPQTLIAFRITFILMIAAQYLQLRLIDQRRRDDRA